MATLQKGGRVFANYSKDDFNRMLAASLLEARGIDKPETCRVRVDYRFTDKNKTFVGARVEVLVV